jgi:multicomponent Na+:H+ antiporter subunit F
MTLNLLELISIVFMGGALLLGSLRLLLGPSAPDRIVSADIISVSVTAGLAGVAAYYQSALFLDIALVYAAISFIGVVALARVIRGNES